MIRAFALATLLALPLPAVAQDQRLADIRAELSILYRDIQSLRDELTTSGLGAQGVQGATPLDRLALIEANLQRLTSKTEELEFRIDRIVRDGTNRIGDLEFRICDADPACDIGSLGATTTLGGVDAEPTGPVAVEPATGGPSLAIAESQDYERAQEALASGDFRGAIDLLAAFNETYPGSPVAAEVHFVRGQAFESLGEMTNAARGYLQSFSTAPEGPQAPQALTKLGKALAAIGQQADACVTLGEVAVRFPGDPSVTEAQSAMSSLGCG